MTIHGRLVAVFDEKFVSMAGEVSLCDATDRSLTYERPTFFIATPLSELKSRSSPLWGLLERTIDLESTSFGRLSRICYEVSQSIRSRKPLVFYR